MKTEKAITEAVKEFGIDKHPGLKDILRGCTVWGLNLETAQVEIKTINGEKKSLVFSEKKEELHYERPSSETDEIFTDEHFWPIEYSATIEKEDNNIVISIFQKFKGYHIDEHGNKGPEKEFIGIKETRIIDENGIENEIIMEMRDMDGFLEKETVKREGLQELSYTLKDSSGLYIQGIGSIEYNPEYNSYFQRLWFLRPPIKPVDYSSVSNEQLEECFKHLTEKQKEGLKKLNNKSFTAGQLIKERSSKTR